MNHDPTTPTPPGLDASAATPCAALGADQNQPQIPGDQPSDPLPALQQQFPAFQIWRENMFGRRRYIARSQHLSVHPHTVITADPDELRAALSRPT